MGQYIIDSYVSVQLHINVLSDSLEKLFKILIRFKFQYCEVQIKF